MEIYLYLIFYLGIGTALAMANNMLDKFYYKSSKFEAFFIVLFWPLCVIVAIAGLLWAIITNRD